MCCQPQLQLPRKWGQLDYIESLNVPVHRADHERLLFATKIPGQRSRLTKRKIVLLNDFAKEHQGGRAVRDTCCSNPYLLRPVSPCGYRNIF
jgi:hypothetical protein